MLQWHVLQKYIRMHIHSHYSIHIALTILLFSLAVQQCTAEMTDRMAWFETWCKHTHTLCTQSTLGVWCILWYTQYAAHVTVIQAMKHRSCGTVQCTRLWCQHAHSYQGPVGAVKLWLPIRCTLHKQQCLKTTLTRCIHAYSTYIHMYTPESFDLPHWRSTGMFGCCWRSPCTQQRTRHFLRTGQIQPAVSCNHK